jgi:hypothetical protein
MLFKSVMNIDTKHYDKYKIDKYRIPKESPTRKN